MFELLAEEKSWSNQRAKRRRRKLQEDEDLINDEKISLNFEFRLRKVSQDIYTCELNSLTSRSHSHSSGTDRELLNQILQFLKNKIAKLIKAT